MVFVCILRNFTTHTHSTKDEIQGLIIIFYTRCYRIGIYYLYMEKNTIYDQTAYNDSPYENEVIPEPEDYRLSDDEYKAKMKERKERLDEDKIKRKEERYYEEKMLEILNLEPPEEFIREMKIGSEKKDGKWVDKKSKYIPIDKVYFLLYRTFGLRWNHTITHILLIANSPVVSCRLDCKVPNTSIWFTRSGTGAKPLSQDAGTTKESPVISLLGLQNSAVQLQAPTADSQALKFAASRLGKLFGMHLDRTDYIDYDGFYNPDNNRSNNHKNDIDDEKVYQSSNKIIKPEDLLY